MSAKIINLFSPEPSAVIVAFPKDRIVRPLFKRKQPRRRGDAHLFPAPGGLDLEREKRTFAEMIRDRAISSGRECTLEEAQKAIDESLEEIRLGWASKKNSSAT